MSATESDGTRPVREGEELDTAALARWLATELPELAGTITVEQFPAGHSNLTYLLRIDRAGGSDGDVREVVLRRPPHKAQAGHDMSREYRFLAGLAPVWPKVPRPLVLCEEGGPFGVSFYLMDRVRGVILRGPNPKGAPPLTEAVVGELCETFVATLAEIHAADLEATGLADLDRGSGYVARQVEGWAGRYERARTDDIPEIDRTIAWLREHRPEDAGTTLIHNDFKYDNLVLDPDDLTRVRAVLDWEMATVGCPLMDLGTSLAYWVEPDDPAPLRAMAFGPTAIRGSLDREGLVARYAALTGRPVADPVFYYAYGLFKLAVIAQQIYWRFQHGYTKDKRFAGWNVVIAMIGKMSERAILTDSISSASAACTPRGA